MACVERREESRPTRTLGSRIGLDLPFVLAFVLALILDTLAVDTLAVDTLFLDHLRVPALFLLLTLLLAFCLGFLVCTVLATHVIARRGAVRLLFLLFTPVWNGALMVVVMVMVVLVLVVVIVMVMVIVFMVVDGEVARK